MPYNEKNPQDFDWKTTRFKIISVQKAVFLDQRRAQKVDTQELTFFLFWFKIDNVLVCGIHSF